MKESDRPKELTKLNAMDRQKGRGKTAANGFSVRWIIIEQTHPPYINLKLSLNRIVIFTKLYISFALTSRSFLL